MTIMRRLAIILIVCGIGLVAHSLLYFFPQAQSHASLASISMAYFGARTQALLGGMMVIAGFYLCKTHP